MPSLSPCAATARALLVFSLATTGCAGAVDVTRTFTPKAASRVTTDVMRPVAIVRGEERIALPPGSRVEVDRALVPTLKAEFPRCGSGSMPIRRRRFSRCSSVSSGPTE